MKRSERGFTLIELLVVLAISAVITIAAGMATVQVISVTRNSNDNMTVIRQVQSAGYWISRDALMAEYASVGSNPEDFLTLNWTEWSHDEDEDSIYHTVTYSFQGLSADGIGKLIRTYSSSDGANVQTLVAEYIYYDASDPSNTTKVSYVPPVLTLQVASVAGEVTEVREYQVRHRPDF